MTWNLFIDDERFPPNDGRDWVIARNIKEVKEAIAGLGFPGHISFDHDLGENQATGFNIARWMIDEDQNYGHVISTDLTFYVHSQNPVGKENIESLMNSYLKFKSEQTEEY